MIGHTCHECSPPTHHATHTDFLAHRSACHGLGDEEIQDEVFTAEPAAPHAVALVQNCTVGEYSASMFSVTSAKCGLSMYLLILEAPELGRGHPLAQLLSGRDAWERASELYDDALSAIRKAGAK